MDCKLECFDDVEFNDSIKLNTQKCNVRMTKILSDDKIKAFLISELRSQLYINFRSILYPMMNAPIIIDATKSSDELDFILLNHNYKHSIFNREIGHISSVDFGINDRNNIIILTDDLQYNFKINRMDFSESDTEVILDSEYSFGLYIGEHISYKVFLSSDDPEYLVYKRLHNINKILNE